MKLIVTEDYEEMSTVACHHLCRLYHGAATDESGGDGGEYAKAHVSIWWPPSRKSFYDRVHLYNFDEIPFAASSVKGDDFNACASCFYSAQIKKRTSIN